MNYNTIILVLQHYFLLPVLLSTAFLAYYLPITTETHSLHPFVRVQLRSSLSQHLHSPLLSFIPTRKHHLVPFPHKTQSRTHEP